MPEDSKPGFLNELMDDLREVWRRMPNKAFFGVLFIAWVLLYQFWGNIVFGYVKTSSLFGWMDYAYANPDDEHGYLIPFVVLGLLWWKRKELMEAAGDVWPPAIGFIILAIGFHLLGYRVQQTRLSIVGFFFGIWGIFGLTWGKEFMKRSFFPMFLFVFCMPLGTEADRITSPLRQFATMLTGHFANGVLGFGVVRDGTRLFDPTGQYQYEVAAACSGLRSLTAIFAFTTVYSFMTFQKNWKRIFLILMAFPLAVISNVTRLLMIIIAAEMFGQEAGTYVHDNSILSLVPYVPGILGVLVLGKLLTPPKETENSATTSEPQLA